MTPAEWASQFPATKEGLFNARNELKEWSYLIATLPDDVQEVVQEHFNQRLRLLKVKAVALGIPWEQLDAADGYYP